MPLQNVADGQAPFVVIDSILSEEAVLGFEYGYERRAEHAHHLGGAVRRLRQRRAGGDRPVHRLGRVKWGRANGLTLMLPHGYEGQGPEHSSARVERFMQLAADNNMQIVQPTSASQIFHLLRRQMVRQFPQAAGHLHAEEPAARAKDATSPLRPSSRRAVPAPSSGRASRDRRREGQARDLACSGKVATT